jgi:hypothetical protein
VPFLRFARDKRGIETFALLYASRRHGKEKPRLLYWFRTPPGIQVGRAAIDEFAVRQLEEAHPDVEFDWPRILHASRNMAAAVANTPRDERTPPARRGRRQGIARHEPPGAAERDDGTTAEAADEGAAPEPERHSASAAAAGLISHVDAERLRARYSELMARIAERVTDPARADALRLEAEALNPDAWVTPDEVARGLETFGQHEQRLREQLGRRRRARRGGARHRRKAGPVPPAEPQGGGPPQPAGGGSSGSSE